MYATCSDLVSFEEGLRKLQRPRNVLFSVGCAACRLGRQADMEKLSCVEQRYLQAS